MSCVIAHWFRTEAALDPWGRSKQSKQIWCKDLEGVNQRHLVRTFIELLGYGLFVYGSRACDQINTHRPIHWLIIDLKHYPLFPVLPE